VLPGEAIIEKLISTITKAIQVGIIVNIVADH
jgi:hypothetical protein